MSVEQTYKEHSSRDIERFISDRLYNMLDLINSKKYDKAVNSLIGIKNMLEELLRRKTNE